MKGSPALNHFKTLARGNCAGCVPAQARTFSKWTECFENNIEELQLFVLWHMRQCQWIVEVEQCPPKFVTRLERGVNQRTAFGFFCACVNHEILIGYNFHRGILLHQII